MTKHLVFRGLGALGALVLAAIMAATAAAQPAPPQVLQGTDGTLYLVQGDTAWRLIPIQIPDDQVATLSVNGDIHGNIPLDLCCLLPPPPPSAPIAPITGTADLTGKAGDDVQTATPIAIGANITSIVDRNTKPSDIYSMVLTAGSKYTFTSSSTNDYGNVQFANIEVRVLNSDSTLAVAFTLDSTRSPESPGCHVRNEGGRACIFIPAISGTYYLQFVAHESAQNYTFTFK